ncbi:MAG: DUF3501 family protein [Gammaproteobacteria bacterium]
MHALNRTDLMSLEDYAIERERFRRKVMEHKQDRRVALGPNVTLYFEDRLTIRYQIQEMLRAEKLFEPEAIQAELAAYNPLIPDGSNLKATMMIEFEDATERRAVLATLGNIENMVWIEVGSGERTFAIADDDLERSDSERTSAVHFLRFELDASGVHTFKTGGEVAMGVDHPRYAHRVDRLPEAVVHALAKDFD